MINVTIQNSDVRDLFVTVLDLNQAGGQVVLNAKRFNRSQSGEIAIQDDGAGLGHVRWQTNVADEPLTERSGEAAGLNDGDTVSVSS